MSVPQASLTGTRVEELAIDATSYRTVHVLLAVGFSLLLLLVAALPIEVSIAAVFLFAGPHNWIEARLLLDRMPSRWGKYRLYYTVSLLGSVSLAATAVVIALSSQGYLVGLTVPYFIMSCWHTTLIAWIVGLVLLRSQEQPARDWKSAIPIGLLITAGAWLWPAQFSLALVYLHPLAAWAFAYPEVVRKHPKWLGAYWQSVCAVAISVLLLLIIPVENQMSDGTVASQIVQHAGASLIPAIGGRALVAIHAYLEILHYIIWLVAMPALTLRAPLWTLKSAPLTRTSWGRKTVPAVLLTGVFAVVVLWIAFSLNYSVTRELYFTLAITHVLAEIPFLIRRVT